MDGKKDGRESVNSSVQQSPTPRKSLRNAVLEPTGAEKAQQTEMSMLEKMLIFLACFLLVAIIGVVVLYLADHKVIHVIGSSEETTHATKVKETTPANKVKETTPAPKVKETTPAPKVKETTPAPKVKETTPAPKVKETTPATKVKETTPATKVKETTPAPKVKETTPAPKVKETTPAPKVKETTPAPKVKETTPATKVKETTPAPKVKETTPAPKVKETTPATKVKETKPAPKVKETTPAPKVKETTPARKVKETRPAPKVKETTPATKVKETTPAPKVKETTPAPKVKETTPAPKVKETTPAPKVKETTPARKVKETTPAPKVKETTPAPKVKETTPATKVKETTPATKVKETTPAPKVKETTPAPKVKETTPAPKVKETTPAPKVKETTPATKVKETTPAPKVKETTPAPKVKETTPATKVKETKPAPKVKETTPAPKVKETTPARKVKETRPAPKVKETTPATKVKETTPAPKVKETTPAPKVKETTPAPKVKETTPAPKVKETTPARKVKETTPAPKVKETTPSLTVNVTKPANKIQEFCLTKGCIQAASRIDSSIDYNVKPCDNFYKYACGRWLKENILTKDRPSLDPIDFLRDRVDITLKALLEEPIRPEEISSIKKAKTLYASCVDKETIKTRGDTPLKTLLNSQLGGWPLTHAGWNESQFDFLTTWSKLNVLGVQAVVNFYVGFDYKNSSRRTIMIDQPGFGMPGQKYYHVDRNDTMLVAYENLILSIARLLGLADPSNSRKDVSALVDFEIKLANISVLDEDRRDLNLSYYPMTVEELQNNYSEIFNWTKMVFNTMSLPEIGVSVTDKEIIINHSPQYFERLIPLLQNTTKRTLANYLIWRFVMSIIEHGAIGDKYEDLFKSYNQVLHGTSSLTAWFKTCIAIVRNSVPLVVSRMFVKDNFDQESKIKVLDMIDELKKALNELLENLDWMDNTTKKTAEEKNAFIGSKIGYPDQVYNDTFIENLYFNMSFKNDTYFENIMNFKSYHTYKELRDLRMLTDKDSWALDASDINAYLDIVSNEIVFTAGILQPPFYSKAFPMSLNFGGIGVAIGHEITHTFDDTGRSYDKFGNLFQWWSRDTETKFKAKAQCIIDQFGNFTIEQIKTKLNGVTTQRENIADNGGLKQSFRAYRNWVMSRGSEELQLPGLNFTHNQLFFINFAQLWCEQMTDEDALSRVRIHQHVPGEYRVIGSYQNSKDFAEAFNCPVGSYMNPTKKCSVW